MLVLFSATDHCGCACTSSFAYLASFISLMRAFRASSSSVMDAIARCFGVIEAGDDMSMIVPPVFASGDRVIHIAATLALFQILPEGVRAFYFSAILSFGSSSIIDTDGSCCTSRVRESCVTLLSPPPCAGSETRCTGCAFPESCTN